MQRYGSIYLVTHIESGAQYVGQTRQKVAKRWNAHYRTAICAKARQNKFSTFLFKEAPASFSIAEVYVAFDAATLNAVEIAYIAYLSSTLNTAKGGAGHRGVVASPEVCKKRSDAAKARWANPEWKAKTVALLKAAHDNETSRENCRALAKSRVGTKAGASTRSKISSAMYARNKEIVSQNLGRVSSMYVAYAAGAKIEGLCWQAGVSKTLFYKYIKQMQLPLFGQQPRG